MTRAKTLLPPTDTIGAFVPHSPPPLAGAADGPLADLSFAVKDLYDIAGYVSGGGSPECNPWPGAGDIALSHDLTRGRRRYDRQNRLR